MPLRATALPADERRAAILRATIPLLLEAGRGVSTRQIAEAAGIAEGTIFRVFPDKEAVLRAAVEMAFDPQPVECALEAIDRSIPFEDQLVAAVEIMQRRLAVLWRLVSAVGDDHVPSSPPPDLPSLVRLFEQHRARLSHPPEKAARHLRALTLAASHPALTTDPMPAREIVTLLLDGIRAPRARRASC